VSLLRVFGVAWGEIDRQCILDANCIAGSRVTLVIDEWMTAYMSLVAVPFGFHIVTMMSWIQRQAERGDQVQFRF
jgi:hypothetical protein